MTHIQQRRQGYASALVALACLLALISGPLLTTLASPAPVALASSASTAASTAPLLPGETLWGGVPSDLFGADTTYDYTSNGLSNNTAIQQHIASAHVPLIRATFEVVDETDHTTPVSDAHQLAIAQAIHSSGAACMADLTQPLSVAQALHLVSLLAPYCAYFEVYNEPDIGAGNWPPPVSVANYLSFWNSFVPQARALDPGAAFGGPALVCEYGNVSGCPGSPTGSTYMEQVLNGMVKSGVAPDFVTFHWYICTVVAQSDCLAETAHDTPTHGHSLATLLASDFPGKHVALGITEYSADPGDPSWAYDDAFMKQFEQTALAGFEQNPYLSFATQFDLASYAGYGTLDLFRTQSDEPFTNTGSANGSPRPSFGVLAGEIARLSAAGSGGGGGGTPTPTPPPVVSGVPRYAHVITILMENHSYSDIIGSGSAPYINGTLLHSGALATNFSAEVASSLPNYLALTGGSTLGLTTNCEPGSGCQSSGPSIASEALAAGLSWRAYEENMTANCQNVVDGGTGGLYTIHHNPFPYYTGLAASCAANDVPYSQLAGDLSSPTSLPAYVFITPNLDHDMHNGTISQGDTWLAQQIPAIQQSAACTASRCLIAVTWDEGSSADNEQVVTILLGPDVQAGARDGAPYNHYSLLHTTEAALGLPTLTAQDAGAPLMLGMFAARTPPTPSPTPSPTPKPSPTPSPTPKPTPMPSPTPSPTPPPLQGVPCIELVGGVMTAGTCVGTFTPNA